MQAFPSLGHLLVQEQAGISNRCWNDCSGYKVVMGEQAVKEQWGEAEDNL